MRDTLKAVETLLRHGTVVKYCYAVTQSCKLPTRHLESLSGWRQNFYFPTWFWSIPLCVVLCHMHQLYKNPTGNQVLFLHLSLFEALNNVPGDLPSDIVKLDLSGNNIRQLRPKQFLLSKDLKLLNLSSNNLHNIDTGNTAAPVLEGFTHTHLGYRDICLCWFGIVVVDLRQSANLTLTLQNSTPTKMQRSTTPA